MNLHVIRKGILFALVTLLFVNYTNAQADYKPGYVITQQGDTLRGLINHSNDIRNAARCLIKLEKNGEEVTTTYSPAEIKSYRLENGRYYVSGTTLREPARKDIFFEYLYEGKMSIYYYKDNKADYFFVEKDTVFAALDENKAAFEENRRDDIRTSPQAYKYKGQLRYLMQDQPKIFPAINNTYYNKEDLIALAAKYQELSSPTEKGRQFEVKTGKNITVDYGFFVAGGPSSLRSPAHDVGGNDYEVEENLDFETSYVYEVGAIVNVNLNFIGENKYAFLVTPSVNFSEYNSYKERELGALRYIYKTNVKFVRVKLPLAFKYSFYSSNWPVVPFFRVGGGLELYASQKGDYYYRSTPLNGSTANDNIYEESLDDQAKLFRGFLSVGAGLDVKVGKGLLTFGAIFETGEIQLESTRSDFMLQVGYIFK